MLYPAVAIETAILPSLLVLMRSDLPYANISENNASVIGTVCCGLSLWCACACTRRIESSVTLGSSIHWSNGMFFLAVF